VEDLNQYLSHLQAAWAARAVRTGDPQVRAWRDSPPAKGSHRWNEANIPFPTLDSPITRAFYSSEAPSDSTLSFGDRTDLRPSNVTNLTIFDPEQEDSKKAALWTPHLEALRDKGWRIAYTDGSGIQDAPVEDRLRSAGVFSEGPCGTRSLSYGTCLGTTASVADAERMAMALALEKEQDGLLAIASDSMAALATLHHLANGGPPRSHIETRIKDALEHREGEVGALWVRSHIGIQGNEAADRRAALEGLKGQRDLPEIATSEGIREKGKAWRADLRTAPGHGKGHTNWGKHALAAYTWTRTNRGPQKAWLHHIGKAAEPSCTCGHPSQDGDHLVFGCPRLATQRTRLLPRESDTWESLDDPHWVTEAGGEGREQEKVEGIEAFFQDLYWVLKRGDAEEGTGTAEGEAAHNGASISLT